jgi:hypothetical protein
MTSSAQNSRQTLLQKGTAAVPGIAFQGDNNTGVYSPGANEIAIATNGSVALSVDSSQNVAMTNALPVGSGGTGFKTYTTGDILYASGSGTLSKLGIGSNGYVLTVNSGVPAWTAAAASGVSSVSFGSTGLTPSTATTGAITVGGTLAIANGGTGATNASNARAALNAAASGSNSDITSLTGLTTPLAVSYGGTGATSASNARSNLGLGSIATQDASNINISGGKILLSTGTGSSVGYAFSSGNASWQSTGSDAFFNFTTGTSIYSTSSGATISANVGGAAAFYVSTSLFEVQVANAAKPGGGSWLASSDMRVKKNVQDYTLSAEALLTLRPVTYQYNGLYGTPDNGVVYAGLIAQEVENTPFSSMVGTYTYNGTELLNLDTSQLVYALINAVQDLTARVKALESGAA